MVYDVRVIFIGKLTIAAGDKNAQNKTSANSKILVVIMFLV